MTSERGGVVSAVCLGEALWDVLPAGIFVGGAPLNVAYHLARHGVRTRVVTAVGRDFLGDELRRRMRSWGLDQRFVARLPRRPTGTVLATLDARGVAHYAIRRRVAWDQIPVPPALATSRPPTVLVFGTLALRERKNRDALARLCAAWPNSWRVLDLNLRPPFTSNAAVTFALGCAQFLKLNDDELAHLTGRSVASPAACERAAREFARRRGVDRVCVTAGARGAGLLWAGRWHWETARAVEVRDTVGCGDAFLAALLTELVVRGSGPAAALVQACRMGEFIATRAGATPAYLLDPRGRPHDRAAAESTRR